MAIGQVSQRNPTHRCNASQPLSGATRPALAATASGLASEKPGRSRGSPRSSVARTGVLGRKAHHPSSGARRAFGGTAVAVPGEGPCPCPGGRMALAETGAMVPREKAAPLGEGIGASLRRPRVLSTEDTAPWRRGPSSSLGRAQAFHGESCDLASRWLRHASQMAPSCPPMAPGMAMKGGFGRIEGAPSRTERTRLSPRFDGRLPIHAVTRTSTICASTSGYVPLCGTRSTSNVVLGGPRTPERTSPSRPSTRVLTTHLTRRGSALRPPSPALRPR